MKNGIDTGSHLSKIDKALKNYTLCKESDANSYLLAYFESIALNIGSSLPKNSIDFLFDRNLSSKNRKFVAISLLRLFTVNNFSFNPNRNLQIKAYSLFDATLSKEIYPKFGIQMNHQNFEKERLLRDVTVDAEKSLDVVIESLTSLKGFSVFRKEFMQTIGNKIIKAILQPFLPIYLLSNARLKELFDNIEDYINNRSLKKFKTLEKAVLSQKNLNKYIDEAKEFSTDYSKRYLVSFATKLYELIDKDVQSFDAGKPTNLIAYRYEKKYPLHEIGKKIFVGIIIENQGPGYAFNVEMKVNSPIDNILVEQSHHNLGRFEPSVQEFKIPVQVVETEEIALIEVEITWTNFNNSISSESFEFEIECQRSDLDWNAIEVEQPYGLEPIETEDELVGREKIINQLVRQSCAKSIGSSYIFGQKRVGKTSIVRALKSRLSSPGYIIIYLEGGDYVCPKPYDTIHKLGENICKKIRIIDNQFSSIPKPEFKDGALSPLIDYLDSVLLLSPKIKMLFIFDEFDELPIELYKRGPLGDSFFLTLRSISGKPEFGFLLVGGERMEFIMSCQGDVLNKFRSMRVDYFDKEKYWNDFQDLVRNPVNEWFDITDESIAELYCQTAGNPFYTKWICSKLFEIMLDRRDCHITISEVKEACVESLNDIAGNSFQHFWEDGIFETTGDRSEEVSIRRRKILLAIASLLRDNINPNIDNIYNQEILTQYHLDEVVNELNQFVRRHVLYEKSNSYFCKVNFFKEWLIKSGISEIMTTFADLDSILERKKKEEESFVRSDEIIDLIANWGIYKGQKITEDRIRRWLNQFANNINQRIMFKLLQGVNFYTAGRIRDKLREAHGIVSRGLILRKEIKQRKRNDILVSYLDGPGKSGGGIYAKLYADENKIYAGNVIEKSKISESLTNNNKFNALVFIDDFIGSGGSATTYFKEFKNDIGQVLNECQIKIYFVAICGFLDKKIQLEQLLDELGLTIDVHICDPLDDSSKSFSENSYMFSNEHERNMARNIAYEYGAKVVRENYLGFGDCQTTIVFETNCPNNNLPILWGESDDWYPLFKRL